MMALVALDSEIQSGIKEYAWKKLRTHLDALGHVPQVPFTLIRLSLTLGDKPKALDVTGAWQLPASLRGPEEVRDLAEILRNLQSLGWMDVAQKLLQQVTIQDAI